MIGRSGWLGASECIYTTWGVRSLTFAVPEFDNPAVLQNDLKV
jgi:hypothetical protein